MKKKKDKRKKNESRYVQITNHKQYYEKLFEKNLCQNTEIHKKEILKEAFSFAIENRRFEIDLYWRRTAFFWAFITTIYTALFFVFENMKLSPCKIFLISVLGGLALFFSLAWHLVNKGSKFWQKNWEQHIRLLEENFVGNIYDIYLNPRGGIGNFFRPLQEYDFSVSKITMFISFVLCVISFFVNLFVLFYIWRNNFCYINYKNKFSNGLYYEIISTGIIIVFFVFDIILFTCMGNKMKNKSIKKNKESNSLGMIFNRELKNF